MGQVCALEIRARKVRTGEIKCREILALEVKPGEWAGDYVLSRGKFPDKSKVFDSRSPCCRSVADPLLPQDRQGGDDDTDEERGENILDPPRGLDADSQIPSRLAALNSGTKKYSSAPRSGAPITVISGTTTTAQSPSRLPSRSSRTQANCHTICHEIPAAHAGP
jgi:hypothetical protein